MNRKQTRLIFALLTILLVGLCLVFSVTTLGSGLILWFGLRSPAALAAPTVAPTRKLASLPSPTPSPSATPTSIPTETLTPLPTPTSTLVPTLTPSMTPSPTLAPPTAALPPSTPTPMPTDTPVPAPSFPFVILETEGYPTNHLNFDVYIAITAEGNKPLSGYRVLGRHSSGLQVESQISANDWTVNSGARQYKGGNLKYEAFNSPTGVWSLQLVDEAGQPVAPPVDFPFDTLSPSWYFILYRQVDQ